MKTFKTFVFLALAVFLVVSCKLNHEVNSQSNRIEAETMRLTNYKIYSEDSTTFIKLTDSVGVAEFNFPLDSGRYDIDARYLSESAGQNTYTMYIGENQIIAFLGKDRDDQWHMLNEQRWHVPRNIEINKGEEIRIEALSETGSRVTLDYIEFTPSTQSGFSNEENLVTIYPKEYEHALKNPLKGFRPRTRYSGFNNDTKQFITSNKDHEYGTLNKNYFKWNELENAATDGVEKIKELCNAKWQGLEKKNIKIIPRVYLAWPNRESGWPADMTTGDFTSDEFKERVIAFIEKLGEAWDNDPRVAYVEMGLIGEWGEMEWPDTRDDIKAAIAAQFAASFQNKLVMIRWPNTYNDNIYNFGYYWDSFAHHDQEYYAFHLNNTSPRWKTAVIGGETAYNWGNVQIQPGKNPNESLTDPVHMDFILDRIRKLHANHLGWIANYDHSDERVRAGAEQVQKALGYRFVITEVSYPKRINTDDKFTVSFRVKNTGSSPFYYHWPVELSLLDPETKQVVWEKQCSDVDIRNWMPGDKWNESTNTYEIPAESILVNQTFQLSEEFNPGEYILALAILDPAGELPCVRFAIENYYTGGRHPIGKVGINQKIKSFKISNFDDIESDTSLAYSMVLK